MSRLQGRMQSASDAEEFEKAGEVKSQMALVRGGLLGSALHFSSSGVAAGRGLAAEDEDLKGGRKGEQGQGLKRDVVAVGMAGDLACFQVFRVRGGRLTGRLGFTYRVDESLSRAEVLQACLERYWGEALRSSGLRPSFSKMNPQDVNGKAATTWSMPHKKIVEGGVYVVDVPDEVVTADALPEGGAALLAELLSSAKEALEADGSDGQDAAGDEAEGKNEVEKPSSRLKKGEDKTPAVNIIHGDGTGERHHLCVMVAKNAELEATRLLKGSEATVEGLSQLERMLCLPSPPIRIEGYDVSHTGGGQAVASVVCFIDGKVSRKDHRRYRIKSAGVRKGHSDDYASLKEVIARRFSPPSHLKLPLAADGVAAAVAADPEPVPDVVLIDGGKGQLAAALEGAALAVKAWQPQGDKKTNGSKVVRAEDKDIAGQLLPIVSIESPDGMATPLDGNSIAQEVDPDAFLLEAEPLTGPLNGRPAEGSRVNVGAGRSVMFVSLAKKEEEVFVPWARDPLAAAVKAGPSSPGVMILRQVRTCSRSREPCIRRWDKMGHSGGLACGHRELNVFRIDSHMHTANRRLLFSSADIRTNISRLDSQLYELRPEMFLTAELSFLCSSRLRVRTSCRFYLMCTCLFPLSFLSSDGCHSLDRCVMKPTDLLSPITESFVGRTCSSQSVLKTSHPKPRAMVD